MRLWLLTGRFLNDLLGHARQRLDGPQAKVAQEF
jgi:hypothetical protein